MRIATMLTLAVLSATLVASLAACEETPEAPPPAPEPEPEPEPPPPPTVDDLEPPRPGRAQVAMPAWDTEHSRFDHPVRDLEAKLGRSSLVTQILLGDSEEGGVMLTFYGEELAPGEHRVLAANDETRAEHAGRDSDVFIASVGQGGSSELRSETGTVTIESANGDAIVGSLDISLKSVNMLRETVVRARFHARPNQWLTAELEHQEAIREQLRKRR